MWLRMGGLLRAAVRIERGRPRLDGLVLMELGLESVGLVVCLA